MRMNVNLGRCSLELTLFTKWAVYVSVAGAIYLIANKRLPAPSALSQLNLGVVCHWHPNF